MTDITFRSRIDAWLAGVVVLVIGLLLVQAIRLYPVSPPESLSYFGLLAFILVLGRLVGYPCEYTLAPDHLVVRSGIARYRVPYADVTSVEPSGSLWAAPALSLRRVKVSRAGGFHLVSPEDRELFIIMLRERVTAARSRLQR
jgi:Bacterial PH domain